MGGSGIQSNFEVTSYGVYGIENGKSRAPYGVILISNFLVLSCLPGFSDILYTDPMHVVMNDDLGRYSVRSGLLQNCGIPLKQVIPLNQVIPQSPDITHFLCIPRVFRKDQLAK